MRVTFTKTDCTAHQPGSYAWMGAVTPRGGGFIRIRPDVRVSARALWRETAPPD